MFTGIIKEVGEIVLYDEASFVFKVSSPFFIEQKPMLGASLAVDGVCLTVSSIDRNILGFDLGLETRKVSLLGQKKPGDLVNLEYSLAIGDRLDGHLVQGHVDGIVKVLSIKELPSGMLMRFSLPENCAHLVVNKGSIAVNGVSLTINTVDETSFSVCIVPHTMARTNLKNNKPDDLVHIETDIIGRYLERLFINRAPQQ